MPKLELADTVRVPEEFFVRHITRRAYVRKHSFPRRSLANVGQTPLGHVHEAA
jgi:hypothetical protein